MGEPIHTETFPLYFEYDAAHKLNYFKNQSQPSWMLSQEKEPMFLWQPNVDPGPNGGTIHNDQLYVKKKRTDFTAQSKRPDPIPNQQEWILSTASANRYVIACDEGSRTNFAVIFPEKGKYVLNLLADCFAMTKESIEQDADLCEKTTQEHLDAKLKQRKDINGKYVKLLEQEESARKETILRTLKDENNDDDFEDIDDDTLAHIGDKDIIREIKKRSKERTENNDVDAEVDFYEDNIEFHSEEIEDDIEDQLLGLERSEAGLLDSEYDNADEEEEKKEKEKPKTPAVTTSVSQQDIIKIADEVTGPKPIKEEELVRYFVDMGQATIADIKQRFAKDFLKTEHQTKVFMSILKKRCKKVTKGNIIYFKLRQK